MQGQQQTRHEESVQITRRIVIVNILTIYSSIPIFCLSIQASLGFNETIGNMQKLRKWIWSNKGNWSSGMIPVLGTGGPGFNSRIAPFLFKPLQLTLINHLPAISHQYLYRPNIHFQFQITMHTLIYN